MDFGWRLESTLFPCDFLLHSKNELSALLMIGIEGGLRYSVIKPNYSCVIQRGKRKLCLSLALKHPWIIYHMNNSSFVSVRSSKCAECWKLLTKFRGATCIMRTFKCLWRCSTLFSEDLFSFMSSPSLFLFLTLCCSLVRCLQLQSGVEGKRLDVAKVISTQPGKKTLRPGMFWALVQGDLQMKVSFSQCWNPIRAPNTAVFPSTLRSFVAD